jgi:hypothetical protein
MEEPRARGHFGAFGLQPPTTGPLIEPKMAAYYGGAASLLEDLDSESLTPFKDLFLSKE